jgi:hypothetical protein
MCVNETKLEMNFLLSHDTIYARKYGGLKVLLQLLPMSAAALGKHVLYSSLE